MTRKAEDGRQPGPGSGPRPRNIGCIAKSELQLGIEQEPEKWIPDWQAFEARWEAEEQAVAVMRRGDFPSYVNQGLSGRVVYRDSRQLAVVKN